MNWWCCSDSSAAKRIRTTNVNNAIHYAKKGKKKRECQMQLVHRFFKSDTQSHHHYVYLQIELQTTSSLMDTGNRLLIKQINLEKYGGNASDRPSPLPASPHLGPATPTSHWTPLSNPTAADSRSHTSYYHHSSKTRKLFVFSDHIPSKPSLFFATHSFKL